MERAIWRAGLSKLFSVASLSARRKCPASSYLSLGVHEQVAGLGELRALLQQQREANASTLSLILQMPKCFFLLIPLNS